MTWLDIISLGRPSLGLHVEDNTTGNSEMAAKIKSVLEAISCVPEHWSQLTGKLQERIKQIELRALAFALGGIEQIKKQKYKCRTIPENVPDWVEAVFVEQADEREKKASERS